jgi:hypothetical protein
MYQRRASNRSQLLTPNIAWFLGWSSKLDSGLQAGKISGNLPTFMSIVAHYSLFLHHLNRSISGPNKEAIPRERPADTFGRVRGLFGLVSII